MLEVKRLTKKYNSNQGISLMDFVVNNGEVAAFVGPNGSCKTTLFRTLAGAFDDYSGSCFINGIELRVQDIKKKIAWLDEKPFVFSELTPLQYAMYMREMKGLQASDDEINKLLNAFELTPYKNQKIKTFSQGMHKKAALIPIFLGKPYLIILDEPTNGLDTNAIITLKQLILEAKKQGVIILISSHVLDFVEKIADRVIFLKEGCIQTEKISTGRDLEITYKEIFSSIKTSKKK